MGTTISVVSVIQAMLAPGLMISACGLLILGMNNKYSMVVNRIRLLNEERRLAAAKNQGQQLTASERERLDSVEAQLGRLQARIRSVRDSVLCYLAAVACFIVSSLFIGLRLLAFGRVVEGFILGSFILGVLAVLAGVACAAAEVWQGYRIMEIEIREAQ